MFSRRRFLTTSGGVGIGLGGLLWAAPSAQAAEINTAVTTAAVNLRQGPGTGYAVLGVVPGGSEVVVHQCGSGWTQVTYRNQLGWIYNGYLKFVSQPVVSQSYTLMTTRTSVNFRSAPSLSSTVYQLLNKGVTVNATGVANGLFSQVVYNSRTGWAYTSYLTPVAVVLSQETPVEPGPAPTAERVTPSALVAAVAYARTQVGKPYVWGAEGPNSFDCSGLTMMAMRAGGITIPRVSRDQANAGTLVSRTEISTGDLIFWSDPVNHVSICVEPGVMVHARNPSVGVVKQTIASYPGMYNRAKRYV